MGFFKKALKTAMGTYNAERPKFQDNFAGVVPEEEWDECCIWAFGEEIWQNGDILVSDTPEAWNALHGDLFEIFGHDDPGDGTVRIGRAYMQFKEVEVVK